jgi:S1-C subfamily serine protease
MRGTRNEKTMRAVRGSMLCCLLLAGGGASAVQATDDPALGRKLEIARDRLEAAARELAALSGLDSPALAGRVFVAGSPDETRRAILGIQLDPEPLGDGARVREVSPGGPAAAAGLRRGDIVAALDGTTLRGQDDPARVLIERMRSVTPGKPLKLRVVRDGRESEYELTPQPAPPPATVHGFGIPLPPGAPASPGAPAAPAAPPTAFRVFPFDQALQWPEALGLGDWLGSGISGMELATLTPRLGEYFGARKGVLVVRAPSAGAWRLEDGDVIVSIDGREPNSGAHASRILRSYQSGETLRMAILRDRKSRTVEVVVPDSTRAAERRRVRVRSVGVQPGV